MKCHCGEMCCQREWILGFLPSSPSAGCCSTQMLQLRSAAPLPPNPGSPQRWPRQRHESAVVLQSCDSPMQRGTLMTIDWHWTGHAGGGRGSACACGCLSRSDRCAHHSRLCRRQYWQFFPLLSLGMCNDPFYLSNWTITLLKYTRKWTIQHRCIFSFRP